MLYHCKDPEKSRVLLLGPKRISAENICGATIYSGLRITSGITLVDLYEKSKDILRNRLSWMKSLIIDELFIVSSNLGKLLT